MKIKVDTKSVIRKVQRAQASVPKKTATLVKNAALRTVARAKVRLQPQAQDNADLAADIAGVRQSINFNYSEGKNVIEAAVFAGNTSGDHMAAYLEFGTGKYAARYVPSLPIDFQRLAMTFYKNGRGTLREHNYLIRPFLDEGKKLGEKLNNLKVDW
jgi:hypothetical protein